VKEAIVTLSIRLDPDTDQRLEALARETGRTKTYYVREAITRFLEDEEDYRLALARLEKPAARVSLAEAKARLGLDD